MSDFLSFRLSDDFVKGFSRKKVDWGFQISDDLSLGELTYISKYSRLKDNGTKEKWHETCRRVIEGMFSIQKDWCIKNRTPWNDNKAQKSAQDAFERMFTFKWLPPGRGIQHMGSELVNGEQNSAPLQNCGFLTTGKMSSHSLDLAVSPFTMMMEMSMTGIGVGFDTKGAGKIMLHQPDSFKKEKVFTIDDSREGWAAAVAEILESYFMQNRPVVSFDYSLIRPAGAPLKRFNGTASGPGPLIKCLESIRTQLDDRDGQFITSRDIVDIMNKIGKAVVAGGTRRSAQIVFGSYEDEDYINIKNWELPENSERTGHDGWAWNSNNSIFAEVGTDYSGLLDKIIVNGEPGLLWLDVARKYGRLIDPPTNADYRALGANPCFTGDTLIAVADGRNSVAIKDLAASGDDVPVYCLNPENGEVEIQWARNPRKTRSKARLVEVRLSDGTSLRVTPDHKFILRNGDIMRAEDLKKNDSLPAFNKRLAEIKKGGNKYYQVHTDVINSNVKHFEHRLIAKFDNPEEWDKIYDEAKSSGWIKGGLVVHHKDYNPLNNDPHNLAIMTHKDHVRLHGSVDNNGCNNPMFGKSHSKESRKKIGAKTKERLQTDEQLKSHCEAVRNGMDNKEVRVRISDNRKRRIKEYYLEQEKETDLDTFWIEDRMYVRKNCLICDEEMVLDWGKRHGVFCSRSCANKNKESQVNRANGLRNALKERSAKTIDMQISTYLDLEVSLGRTPMRKEWESSCREKNIPRRFQKDTDNPNILRGFKDLRERAAEYNHRVIEVVELDEREDVYNLTVDKHQTVGIVTSGGEQFSGVFTFQCSEQTLEDAELCTLVELFPCRHDSLEDFKQTIKYAYLYGKSVTLLPTNWPDTNSVMARNRRIGCSMSGLAQFVEDRGWFELRQWMDEGYKHIQERDKTYSEWLAVRESIKKTSIKPSGTVSLLCGATPGVHWPTSSGQYIRRVRYAAHSPIVDALRDAGVTVEPDHGDPENTVVAEFVIDGPDIRSERDVSLWEKAELVTLAQKWWADNQVSATLTFTKDEQEEIAPLLRSKDGEFKSISFLPIDESGTNYAQAPYEPVTSEYAKLYREGLSKIDVKALYGTGEDVEDEKFCTNDSCTI